MLPFFVLVVLLGGERLFPAVLSVTRYAIGVFACSCQRLAGWPQVEPNGGRHRGHPAALPVAGILVGVGMFIQIMTMTGVRGFFVVSALALPAWLLYVGIATSLPLFGAVSAYGSATVLGVPFLLALLGRDEIVVGSALA